ncbi:MAG: hypothetical protein QW067_12365 [Thermofilaceae archaeon]
MKEIEFFINLYKEKDGENKREIFVDKEKVFIITDEMLEEALKEIYLLTEEEDIDVALDVIRTSYKKDQKIYTLGLAISKLLQLDASGKIKPHINFGPFYEKVILKLKK